MPFLLENSRRFSGSWVAVIKASLAYFAVVFGCAFLFGIFRVLALTPAVGKTGAVVVELPLILGISWITSEILIVRFGVPRTLTQRLAMGGLAFTITMVAEAGLSIFVFGQPLSLYLESIWNLAGLLGLSGQLGFALIPTIHLAFKPTQQTSLLGVRTKEPRLTASTWTAR